MSTRRINLFNKGSDLRKFGFFLFILEILIFFVGTSYAEEKKSSSWIVPAEEVSHIEKKLAGSINKGNILKNSSFELGSDGWAFPFKLVGGIKTGNAYHGQRSAPLHQSFAWVGDISDKGWMIIQSLYYPVKPGHLYTVSVWLKAVNPDTKIRLAVLSGHQKEPPGSGSLGFLIGNRPGAARDFSIGTDWQRVNFAFIPTEQPKSSISVLIGTGDAYKEVWVDAVQLEEGGLTLYEPSAAGEVGCRIMNSQAIEKGDYLFTEGTGVDIETTGILYEKPAEESLSLTYHLTDYYQHEVKNVIKKIEPGSVQELKDRVSFSNLDMGIYKLVLEVSGGGKTFKSKEISFGVLSKDLENLSLPANDFFFGGLVVEKTLMTETMEMDKKVGIRWNRLHCGIGGSVTNWEAVEPEKGRFQWDDKTVEFFEKNNLSLMGVLGQWIPKWAQTATDPNCGSNGYRLEDYLDYVKATVTHYKDKIRYWEAQNEPYWSYKAEDYAKELKETYRIIKGIDPALKVVGVCGHPVKGQFLNWIDDVLKFAGTECFDIFSYHGYMAGLPSEADFSQLDKLEAMKNSMRKYGKVKPMWDTETSIQAGTFYSDRHDGGNDYPGTTIADYQDSCRWLTQMSVIDMANGVERLFNFPSGINHTGSLLTLQHSQGWLEYTHAPRPIMLAQAALTRFLTGASFKEEIKFSPRVRCYLFKDRNGETVAVLWGLMIKDKDKVRLEIPLKDKVKMYGIVGNIITCEKEGEISVLPLTRDAIYLVSKDEESLVRGLKAAQISGVVQPQVSDWMETAPDGNASVMISVENVASQGPLSGEIKLTSIPEGMQFDITSKNFSSIAVGKKITNQFIITQLPVKGDNILAYRVKVDGIDKEFTGSVRFLVAVAKSVPITIDGDLSDWQEAMTDEVKSAEAIVFNITRDSGAPGQNWANTNDLSFNLMSQWDKERLYFAFGVNDDKIIQDQEGANSLWAADCIELMISPPRGNIYVFYGLPKENKVGWSFRSAIESGPVEGMSVDSNKGYNVEASLPIDFLGVKELKPGQIYRFTVNVNDKDNPQGERKTVMVWSGTIKNSIDSTDYGYLIMGKKIK